MMVSAALVLALGLQGTPAAPELPGAGRWVNGPDVTLGLLRGKAVLLYFFEPTCSNCKDLVPSLNELAQKYDSKPAAFLAISSGTPRRTLEDYAKGSKFEWPILVDRDRQIEGRYGQRITMSNIFWLFVVAPDGTYREFGADLAAAERHLGTLLPKGRMLFDGINVPPELEGLRRRLERGERGSAVKELFQALSKGGTALEMYSRVRPAAESALERARASEVAGDRIVAYDAFCEAARDYPGTPQGAEGAKGSDRLRREKDVKLELSARAVLEQAQALEAKGKVGRMQARSLLQGLIQSAPQTPSAEPARRLLAILEAEDKK